MLIAVFQPILSSSKHIDKSGDYSYLHPCLGTGLLTSAGEIFFLESCIYTTTLRTMQLALWELVEMKKCWEITLILLRSWDTFLYKRQIIICHYVYPFSILFCFGIVRDGH
jgi:hypothetical protein